MDFEKRYRTHKEFSIARAVTRDRDALGKLEAKELRRQDVYELHRLQERLYAESRRSLLVVFQALDAAGKDSTIEHVMTGVNPQGVRVVSFKQPSTLELSHDFLWRCQVQAPRAGEIVIFNRSHYEDVIVTRVHPELLESRGIDAARAEDDAFWEQRYAAIRNWEAQLAVSGTEVIKLFLHVSTEVQRERLLARAADPQKNWKFSAGDVAERDFRTAYERAYEAMIRNTWTRAAPWYVIPADRKWLMRTAVASILRKRLEAIDPQFPKSSEAELAEMRKAVGALKSGG